VICLPISHDSARYFTLRSPFDGYDGQNNALAVTS
jgi:hypothetical protein